MSASNALAVLNEDRKFGEGTPIAKSVSGISMLDQQLDRYADRLDRVSSIVDDLRNKLMPLSDPNAENPNVKPGLNDDSPNWSTVATRLYHMNNRLDRLADELVDIYTRTDI